jgi:hypothetical protein
MKGIVFNLLEDVVKGRFGDDVWDELLDQAGVVGAYTSLGSYSDDEIFALVNAASAAFAMPPKDVLRWFGREAMIELAVKYPVFFAPHQSSRPFILSVNNIIHPEVRKLYAGAACPYFHFQDSDDGTLSMTYRSPRKLCHLAEGFVEGAAAHYGERVDFHHAKCLHHGDDRCVFEIRWPQERKIRCTAA